MESSLNQEHAAEREQPLDFNTMLIKLRKLFEYYCQFGERMNWTIMKSNKFMKICKEANLIQGAINRTRLELIYKTENKYNTMNFDQFLNCMMKISQYKYKLEDLAQIREGIIQIINDHFLPLYQFIFSTEQNLDSSVNMNTSVIVHVDNVDTFWYSPICEEILSDVVSVMFDIYRVYFAHEISIAENFEYVRENSIKQFFSLMKDFEIAPGLISKPAAFQAYQSEVQNDEVDASITGNKDFYLKWSKKLNLASLSKYDPNNLNILGQYFIFFKFIRTLVKLSDITFKKMDFHDLANEEKLIWFFQKMEMSEGFQNFEWKTSKTHCEKYSAIIKESLMNRISFWLENKKQTDEEFDWGKENNNIIMNSKMCNNKDSTDQGACKPKNYDKSILLSDKYDPEYVNYINEVYGSDLIQIFKGLCACGDQFNYKYMKSKAFLKFLVDANLVRINARTTFGLKMNDVDTLFIKLYWLNKQNDELNNNVEHQGHALNKHYALNNKGDKCGFYVKSNTNNFSQSRIEFETFLIGIEIIAKVLFPRLETKEAIDKVINQHIISNLKHAFNTKVKSIEEKIECLKELQNDEEYVHVLEIVHKVMTPVYNYYTKATNYLMNLKQFLEFTQDFELFPSWISKTKWNHFFVAIAQSSNQENNNINPDDIKIEQSLFVDIWALCANEIVFPEPEENPIERILVLMERFGQSEGHNNIVRKTGRNRMSSDDALNIIEQIKEEYPQYFEMKEKKKLSFMDLMSG